MKRLILGILLCFLLIGCSGQEPAQTTTTTQQVVQTTTTTTTQPVETSTAPMDADVRIVGREGFDPETITVRAGGTVTWKVTDDGTHVIVENGGLFRSERLMAHDPNKEGSVKDSFSYTFEEPGTYEYTNVIYGRKGTVIVE